MFGKVCFVCGASEFKYMVIDHEAGITYYQCRDCGWEDIIVIFETEEEVL
jgi:hypothetical protein